MCLMPCLRMAVLIRVLLLTLPRKARSVSRIWRTPGWCSARPALSDWPLLLKYLSLSCFAELGGSFAASGANSFSNSVSIGAS